MTNYSFNCVSDRGDTTPNTSNNILDLQVQEEHNCKYQMHEDLLPDYYYNSYKDRYVEGTENLDIQYPELFRHPR